MTSHIWEGVQYIISKQKQLFGKRVKYRLVLITVSCLISLPYQLFNEWIGKVIWDVLDYAYCYAKKAFYLCCILRI